MCVTFILVFIVLHTNYIPTYPLHSTTPLGPTLFLLYVNDLTETFENLNCFVKLYTDDEKLYSSFKLGDYSTVLVNASIMVQMWQLRIANAFHTDFLQ